MFVRLLLIFAGLVSSILTARFLGPEGRGLFFYWSTMAAFAIQFGNLGLSASCAYLLTKRGYRLSQLTATSLWVAICGSALFGLLLIVFLFATTGITVGDWPYILPTLLLIPTGLYFVFGSNLLIADDRVGEYNLFELVNRYIPLVVMAIVLWYYASAAVLLATVSLLAVPICVALHLRLRKIDNSEGFSLSVLREGFGYSLRAYLAITLGFVVLRANLVILKEFTSGEEFGIWSAAAQIFDVLIVIPSTVGLVLLPKILRSERPYALMKSQVAIVALVMLSLCFVVYMIGHPLLILLYGDRFGAAYPILIAALPGAIALGITSVISPYFASEGMPINVVWIWVAGVAVEICMAFLFIPIHGGVGAMISLSITYTWICALIGGYAVLHERRKAQ